MKLGGHPIMSTIADLIRQANHTKDSIVSEEERLATLIDIISELDLGDLIANPFNKSSFAVPNEFNVKFITSGVPLTLEETQTLLDLTYEAGALCESLLVAGAKLITHKRTLEAQKETAKDV